MLDGRRVRDVPNLRPLPLLTVPGNMPAVVMLDGDFTYCRVRNIGFATAWVSSSVSATIGIGLRIPPDGLPVNVPRLTPGASPNTSLYVVAEVGGATLEVHALS